MRHPSGLEANPRAPGVGQRGDEPIIQRRWLSVSRLEVVRAVYGKQGFSGEVVKLFGGPSDQIPPARMIAPGETGQTGVWEGVKIPCLMI
jgi:hypothetical protein